MVAWWWPRLMAVLALAFAGLWIGEVGVARYWRDRYVVTKARFDALAEKLNHE